MPDIDVCVVGSVNLDLVLTADRLPKPGETVLGRSLAQHPGGKGLNQAVAAARAGAQTALCCCIGADEAGRRLGEEASGAGLGEENVHLVPDCPTGRALIAVDDEGQNFIIVIPGANAELTPAMAVAAVRSAHVALAQLEVPVEAVTAAFRTARDGGAITILNPSPAEAVTSELLSLSDYVVLNEHEALALGGADGIFAAGAGELVITLGDRGSIHERRGGETQEVASFPVAAVDTTAAGDAYCGAFAASLAGGGSVREAMRVASAAGALATTKRGAVPSLPGRSEIDALLGAH